MATADKCIFFDSDDGNKAKSSEDSSLELSAVYLIPGLPGHNKLHTVPCQYLFSLEMALEDFRSHLIERNFFGSTLKLLLASHESFENNSESFFFHKTEATELDHHISKSRNETKSKIKALEEINDYFFDNLDLIQDMEERYVDEIDCAYLCGRYHEQLRKVFFNEELKRLEDQRKELEDEKQEVLKAKNQLKLAKRNFDSQAENLKKMMEESHERIILINKESEMLKEKKEEFDEAVRKFQEEKFQFQKKKEEFEAFSDFSLTPRSGSTNERSPRRTESSSEYFREMIENIKKALESKSPPEVAASFIESIKSQYREMRGFYKVDEVELKCLKSALEIRAKAFEKYEVCRKNELAKAKKMVDSEIVKIKNFWDRRSSNYQNLEVLGMIRENKQKILAAEEEIKLVMNAIYSLQYEIMNSIETFKDIYSEILRQNRELKMNFHQVQIFAMDFK